jgi:hypothetical protein
VDRARGVAVGAVGGDERDERDDARLGEQRRGVRGAADVLRPVVRREAEVAVQAVAQVVAVEPQRRPPAPTSSASTSTASVDLPEAGRR